MAVHVTYRGGIFVCRVDYADRQIPKEAGFRFSKEMRAWYTPFHTVAVRLREHADKTAQAEMEKVLLCVSPWSKPLAVPKGQTLKPWQPDLCTFVLSRNKSYLAADPGIGKTPVAAVCAATLAKHNVVYLCPPFLVLNTVEELKKWAPKRRVAYVTPKNAKVESAFDKYDTLVVPDSLVARAEIKELILRHAVQTVDTFLIVDEAHRYKNKDAKRTMAVYGNNRGRELNRYGLVGVFDKTVLMSGTPMPNRPIELFHMLSKMAPQCIDFMTEFQFGMKYCQGFRTPYGWDFSGSDKDALKELARKTIHPTGPFMLRLRKDKLGLPPKTEEIVIVGTDMSKKLAELNQAILREHSVEDLMKQKIAKDAGLEFEGQLHVATYRRLMSLEKVPFTTEFVSDLLDSTDEAVLLFAVHKEAIAKLVKNLYAYDPIVITGKTPKAKRHQLVKDFQHDKARRLFIGNIQAAGVGLTLTKGSRVVFHEYMWVPGENDQAADRAHRVGQTKRVHIQYLAHRDSVDMAVLRANLNKRGSIAII